MRIFLTIIISIILLFLSFILGIRLKDNIHLKEFEQCQKGMNIKQTRKILGNPDETKLLGEEIMDVYYYFPMGESRFFYSPKTITLIGVGELFVTEIIHHSQIS